MQDWKLMDLIGQEFCRLNIARVLNPVFGRTMKRRTHKMFLLFLNLWTVLIKTSKGVTLTSLGSFYHVTANAYARSCCRNLYVRLSLCLSTKCVHCYKRKKPLPTFLYHMKEYHSSFLTRRMVYRCTQNFWLS